MKPVFLDVQEYHKICECPQGSSSSNNSESHPYVDPTLSFLPVDVDATSSRPLPIMSQSGRCGVVPIPAPLVFVSTTDEQGGQNEEVDEPQNQPSDAVALSLPTPRISVIDYSMSNAWFPGHLGGVSFAKLPSASTDMVMREKIICAVDFQPPDVRGVLNRPEESECLTLGGRRREQVQEKMNAYVYETYDPEKRSMHRGLETAHSTSGAGVNPFTSPSTSDPITDPHKCPRCIQREALIRLERKKAEHRSKMMLDRRLRSFGRSGGYDWNQDEDMFYDDGDDEDSEEEEGDEEMRDVDVDELDIDMEGIVAQATASSSGLASPIQTDEDEEEQDQLVSFGDDELEEPPEMTEMMNVQRKRKCYDKSRIGVQCKGVGDVLLSGEVGFFLFFSFFFFLKRQNRSYPSFFFMY